MTYIRFHSVAILLVRAGLLLASAQAYAQPAINLQVAATTYEGAASGDGRVQYFLGIPFAQAPVAELRWEAPRPLQKQPARRQATAFAPACAQTNHIVAWYRDVVTSFGGDPNVVLAPSFSEDCLYLNIWKPSDTGSARLPVIVYIHGGSNKGGWSYEPNYIGENLARRGVVVVSIAYRLGVFGFFAHPELEQANFALLDQIAALSWVAEHIGAAGGDPANVTVMGESAGASDITHLLVSPLAKGLFKRVIHQSAGWAVLGRTSADEHQSRGLALQRELFGAQGDIDRLRKVPAQQLMAAATEVFQDYYYDPVIDGFSLAVSVSESLEAGEFPSVDLMIGSNADEWLMYLEEGATLDGWLAENLGPGQAQAIKSALPATLSEAQSLDRLITAQQFVCPSMYLAARVNAGGGRSWFYYFSRQREGEQAASMGAYHGAELPYVFDTHDDWLPTNNVDRQLTDSMMSYWVNFARGGDPNGPDLPVWPRFKRQTASVQVLDKKIESMEHGSRRLCELLMPANKPR